MQNKSFDPARFLKALAQLHVTRTQAEVKLWELTLTELLVRGKCSGLNFGAAKRSAPRRAETFAPVPCWWVAVVKRIHFRGGDV